MILADQVEEGDTIVITVENDQLAAKCEKGIEKSIICKIKTGAKMMILVIFAPFVYNITLSKTGKERKTL